MLCSRAPHLTHLTPHEVLHHQRVKTQNHLHSQESKENRLIPSLQLYKRGPGQASPLSSDPLGQSSQAPTVQKDHLKSAEETGS